MPKKNLYSLSRPDHAGGCYVTRTSDQVIIGRVWKEEGTWEGRYYFGGGGTTTGGFNLRREAAGYVYEMQKDRTTEDLLA